MPTTMNSGVFCVVTILAADARYVEYKNDIEAVLFSSIREMGSMDMGDASVEVYVVCHIF